MIISTSKDKQNLGCSILEEENFLINYLKLQERINLSLSSMLKQSCDSSTLDNIDESRKLYDDISPIYKMINKSFVNIDSVHSLQKKLDLVDLSNSDFGKKIENYNSAYIKAFDKIVKETTILEQYLFDATKDAVATIPTVSASEDEVVSIEETSCIPEIVTEEVILPEIQDQPVEEKTINPIKAEDIIENTLVVSEVDNKVVLPYSIDTLNTLLAENPEKYKDINSIIEEIYTKPLKYYKHSSIARFKEAYNLVRKRSHGSVLQALDLGLELFSNYNLHPAVISACKNLDELDIYLSCLQYNELNDFHFFKTLFKVNPLAVKNNE